MTYSPENIAVHKGVGKVICDTRFELDCFTLTTPIPQMRIYFSYMDIMCCQLDQYHLFTWEVHHTIIALQYHESTHTWLAARLNALISRNTFANSFEHWAQPGSKARKEEGKKEKVFNET